MLQDAAKLYGIDLSSSFMVGDSWRDVEAGQNAGCQTILIDYGYEERQPNRPPDARVQSLSEATEWILQNSKKGVGR
jgi:D-glycero-D-manno-heptose 1,7-bisphosphate phosphatase